jgi:hypothetical protein
LGAILLPLFDSRYPDCAHWSEAKGLGWHTRGWLLQQAASTAQSVKLDLAFRICKALDADVSVVFFHVLSRL